MPSPAVRGEGLQFTNMAWGAVVVLPPPHQKSQVLSAIQPSLIEGLSYSTGLVKGSTDAERQGPCPTRHPGLVNKAGRGGAGGGAHTAIRMHNKDRKD